MSFADFVAERQRPLLRFAMVLIGDPRLAEDIVADVLGRAFERWDQLAVMAEPGAYVRRMVVNDFISWRRRLARVRPFTVVDGGQIDDHAAVHAERSAVLAGLATLPRRQRTALVLRFYEDLSYQEIAETLGCTAGAARSYVSRGLSTLRIDMVCDDGHPRSSVTIERGKQP